jgi:hypothetical protein
MVGDLGDHLDVRACLGQDQLIDAAHIGRGQLDQLGDRRRPALATFEVENNAHRTLHPNARIYAEAFSESRALTP